MTDRFNPTDIFAAHLKGLKNRTYNTQRPTGVPDKAARFVLYVAPVGAGVAVFVLDGSVAGPEGILAAAGILTGAFFMGFGQVASWRERFTERRRDREHAEVHQRDSLDEAIAHLLVAIYATIGLAVVVSIGMNFTDDTGRLVGVWAALTATLGLYIVLLLLVVLPKLYTAYAGVNELDDEMSGLSH